MAGSEAVSAAEPSLRRAGAFEGLHQLKAAFVAGFAGQLLIWGSAISLWVFGALFSPIPTATKVDYGANGFWVSAGAVFGLNYALIAGAVVALLSLLWATRGFQRLARASPALKGDAVVSLTTVGFVGFGMVALGWVIWLGSFVGPGPGPNSVPGAYTPVLGSNLADVVDLFLIIGGLLAFFGMLGLAVGSARVGATYEEDILELGSTLTLLPVFSLIGFLLCWIGLGRGEGKVERGWIPSPPPPPPAPNYPPMPFPAGYPAGTPLFVPRPEGSWDGIAVVLVVVLVLLWVFILPLFLVFAADTVRGPGGVPGGGSTAGPSASLSDSPAPFLLLVGLGATAILLPLVIVRNRRKRQRLAAQSITPPPPPPPQPRPRVREDDPLDHLV